VRFTIERLRTLVLVAGGVLLAALVAFLVIGKWKHPFNSHDLPKRLGVNIQQEANGFTHAEFRSGKAIFRINASKLEQLKNGHVRLHSVEIELYGAQGSGVDRIVGDEFEYDQQAGIAQAVGPVSITLTRATDTPAVVSGTAKEKVLGDMPKTGPIAAAMANTEHGAVHVRTSGLLFDQKKGIVRTASRVDFDMAQGTGSAVGAVYDSQAGELTLDHAVSMQTHRGDETVTFTAQHATFARDDHTCQLTDAAVAYRNGEARATEAKITFHEDGSAEQLNATKGFVLTTTTGGQLTAPTATLLFAAQNQPSKGNLLGGVSIDAVANGRSSHGTAPAADLIFGKGGVLQLAHMVGGVQMTSDETAGPVQTHRKWVSPTADLAFRSAEHGQLSLASIHGIGGVTVTSETIRGGIKTPARFVADDVTGTFGADSALTAMTGSGHATMEQITQQGARQTTSGDRLEAHFSGGAKVDAHGHAAAQVESATVTGHVVLVQQPSAKSSGSAQQALRATAGRAVYEGTGEWLHLTASPRVDSGGVQISADRLDVSQDSGDAFAHGNVKATWLGDTQRAGNRAQIFGGQGPAHVVAAEAQLHQATGEASFQGQARLWQQANSIWAPTIVLDRTRQTLTAHSGSAADPVRVVLVSAALSVHDKAKPASSPSVVRLRGGDLKYSDAERKAFMRGNAAVFVVAETAGAVTRSDEVDVMLVPAGTHAAGDTSSTQVDRITARGHVTIESQSRHGWGQQLVYTNENGTYKLTGSPGAPPRLIDPQRGSITGEALIFNSRDDSVIVDGGGRETTTETTVPKRRP
jgi:lipopolysaccharide export system protein LptA